MTEQTNGAPASAVQREVHPKHTPEDRAVLVHLVKLIQGNADVRYFVGGWGTEMRVLLFAAIKASGFDGPPEDALKPAPHRANDKPRVQELSERLDATEDALAALRRVGCQDTGSCGADEPDGLCFVCAALAKARH